MKLPKLQLLKIHNQDLKIAVSMNNKLKPKLKCLLNFNKNNNNSKMLISSPNKTIK